MLWRVCISPRLFQGSEHIMAKRGRPVRGADLVRQDCCQGSGAAQQRLRTILQTLAGVMTIREACGALSIGRSRFHALRSQFLQQAAGLLEPKPRGRQRHPPGEAELQLLRMRHEIAQLKLDLKAAQIREEIALVMPHLLKDSSHRRGQEKKKRRASRRVSRGGPAPRASRPTPRATLAPDRSGHGPRR
jgi:hypothetical protein